MMGRLKTGRPSFNFAPDSIAVLAAKPSVLRRAIGGLIATMPFYCSAVSMTSASQKAEKLALAFAVHNVIESGLLCFQSRRQTNMLCPMNSEAQKRWMRSN